MTPAQLVAEYQSHTASAAVDVNKTPLVQYDYADGSSNQARPTGITYPDGSSFEYNYGPSGGTEDLLSRVKRIRTRPTALVAGVTLSSTIRSNFPGWVGFKLTVGKSPIVVRQLGRWVRSTNTQTHDLKIKDASGNDVSGALVTINTVGATPGAFLYGTLAAPIVLAANTVYYILSHEVSGGDDWYEYDSALTPTDAGTINSGAFFYDNSNVVSTAGSTGNSFGPVSLRYSVLANETLVTGQTLSSNLRNNFPGWVGCQFTVGSTPLVVRELGRWIVSGNSQTHTIKIVDNSGNDVSGASVSLNTSGKTAGAFAYVALSAPVVLSANTTYCLLSHETSVGGDDQWYDYDCSLSSTPAATINKGAFFYDGSTVFSGAGSTGNCFGPVSLRYEVTATQPLATDVKLSTNLLSNATGWRGFKFTTGTSGLIVRALGRWIVSGNSGTHTIKIVTTGGTDVSGASVSLNTSGKTAGAFAYVALASPVTLPANTVYYVVSQETSGGDQWYDYDCALAARNYNWVTGERDNHNALLSSVRWLGTPYEIRGNWPTPPPK